MKTYLWCFFSYGRNKKSGPNVAHITEMVKEAGSTVQIPTESMVTESREYVPWMLVERRTRHVN